MLVCVALSVALAPAMSHATPAAQSAAPTAKNKSLKKAPRLSPYAKAAGQREHDGKAPVGHAPTHMQGRGTSHKTHTVPAK
jgi:hypothetical protein